MKGSFLETAIENNNGNSKNWKRNVLVMTIESKLDQVHD